MFLKARSKNKVNYIAVIGLLIAIFLLVFAFDYFYGTRAQSDFVNYSTGDAVNYQGEVIIASVDSGKLELFKLVSHKGRIEKSAEIISVSSKHPKFFSVVLFEKDGKLYAYAVNGRYIYQYDVSNLTTPRLIKSVKDNSWDWFMRLRKTSSNIITVGNNGLKVWNNNLQVINGYKNPDKDQRVYLSKDGKWLFDVKANYKEDKENDFVDIINTKTREKLLRQNIVLVRYGERSPYVDSARQLAYIAGDRVIKQINLSTKEIKNFRHDGEFGFDIDGFPGEDYFYFSNGTSIVKMSHSLEPLDAAYTRDFNVLGSWATRIVAVKEWGQDRIVVFNKSNIAVLDNDLDLTAFRLSTETAEDNKLREPLSLSLNRNRAPQGSQVTLQGTGFVPNEELILRFGKTGSDIWGKFTISLELSRFMVKADENGRFQRTLTVPSELPKNKEAPFPLDIIVEGVNSGLRYSIGFMIQ